MSLFSRTFFLLAILLAAGVFAWVQTLRALELEPRAVQAAQQIAGLVNLTRAALASADGIHRITLVKTMGRGEAIRVTLREPGDRWEPYEVDRFSRRVGRELRDSLGPDAVVARSVNGQAGLWVGFPIESDRYWLQAEAAPVPQPAGGTWLAWMGIAGVATLLGSAGVARLINRPLRRLSFAASRIREGDLDSRLDESTLTSEIREVNMGFNRMARELARVEADRAVMLAGISHDLRTPLARLRLEAEMSVADEEARRNIAMDIDQLDAIIDKFMDYARPGQTRLKPVSLAPLVEREAANFRDPSQIRITSRLPADLQVMADDTELGRVMLNLFENARRYARVPAGSPGAAPPSPARTDAASRLPFVDSRGQEVGTAQVEVSHARTGPWVVVTVRDHGPGVAPEKLSRLTTPFFRGDAARTAASGAGLGLAIGEKAMQRMGGSLELANAPGGGLMAHLRLRRAP